MDFNDIYLNMQTQTNMDSTDVIISQNVPDLQSQYSRNNSALIILFYEYVSWVNETSYVFLDKQIHNSR